MRQDIIERLMCDMRVDAKAVANQHGFELSDVLSAVVAAFDLYLTADHAPPERPRALNQLRPEQSRVKMTINLGHKGSANAQPLAVQRQC